MWFYDSIRWHYNGHFRKSIVTTTISQEKQVNLCGYYCQHSLCEHWQYDTNEEKYTHTYIHMRINTKQIKTNT